MSVRVLLQNLSQTFSEESLMDTWPIELWERLRGPVRHPEASSSSLGNLYMPMLEGTRESVPGPFGS